MWRQVCAARPHQAHCDEAFLHSRLQAQAHAAQNGAEAVNVEKIRKFRSVWNAAKTRDAAAKKLGLKPRSASVIASALRRNHKVRLKSFGTRGVK